MENTAYIALSRQAGLQRHMNVIANNLANLNTTGFKLGRLMFIDHLVRTRGGDAIGGDQLAYVRDIATYRDTAEGGMETTGNPLDVAIRGVGFLALETDKGDPRYSRNGRFRLNEEGKLVNNLGMAVLSESGQPFFFSPEDKQITIARDGTISTENGDLGRLRIVRFKNDQQLRETESGLYQTDQTPEDADQRDVVQGMLESSNVEAVVELTRMIEVQRAYESVKQLLDREDERLKRVVRELASTAAA